MRDLPDRLQTLIEDRDEGVVFVQYDEGAATECFRMIAPWSQRAGYASVIADEAQDSCMPQALFHRHVLIVCSTGASTQTAIRWLRELAATSPRRHLILAPAVKERPSAQPSAEDYGEASTRERRAARWQRRGRARISERWLVAAIESARRHQDERRATALDLGLIQRWISRGNLDESARRLRHYLTPDRPWREYADAATLRADVLIAQRQLMAARAWTTSVMCELTLRGEEVPEKLAGVLAELDFWQARSGSISKESHADASGWRALSAWSARDADTLRRLTVALGARARADPQSEYWRLSIDLLRAPQMDPARIASRCEAIHRVCESLDRCARRRRRLADGLVVRAALLNGHRDLARRLVNAAKVDGPEEAVCRRLLQSTPGRAESGGVLSLTSWRNDMPLVDGLPSLLSVLEEADDELTALTGGCQWLVRRIGAKSAGIVSADGATLVAAEGWRQSDVGGEIANILGSQARDVRGSSEAVAPGFGVSVRSLGVVIGYVVVRGQLADRESLQQAALLFATVCGPAVRARLDLIASNARAHHSIPEIVGNSPLMAAVRDAIVRAAAAPFPVLIEGESGTGKELVARALHKLGPRRDRRLNAVNCAALTDELVEAELFGHVRGAFTGAIGQRIGLFEESHGGTLFLDEVTELSLRGQAKLLRVIQEREIRRVGENQPRAVDVRVIAACNTPVGEAVAAGRFRDDLRFRLAVVRIQLPPLRDRVEDIPTLAVTFWRRAAAEAGTRATLGADALVRLTRHSWPGNVRELQNAIAGLVVAAPTRGRVSARHVEHVLTQAAPVTEMAGVRLEAARRSFERRVVLAALSRHAGRRPAAAAELGLTRQGLTKALRRLGLVEDESTAGVA